MTSTLKNLRTTMRHGTFPRPVKATPEPGIQKGVDIVLPSSAGVGRITAVVAVVFVLGRAITRRNDNNSTEIFVPNSLMIQHLHLHHYHHRPHYRCGCYC
jgi:hypothetical protein